MSEFSVYSMSSTEVTSLSANYRFDLSASPKVDLLPERYDYPDEGFTLFHHGAFEGTKDERFANRSFLGLTSGVSLGNVMSDYSTVDASELVIYTTLRASNGKFLKCVEGKLYAISDEDDIVMANLFKIYKRDGYFMISQGEKFATVSLLFNAFTISMEDYISIDLSGAGGNQTQKFWLYQGDTIDKVMIYSMLSDTWGATKDVYSEQNQLVKRFWSIYDGAIKPKYVYDGVYDNLVKANGMWKDVHVDASAVSGYADCDNDYVFTVGDEYLPGLSAVIMGFDGKVRWVRYHNDFYEKFWNSDVTPREVIETVRPNFLIEFPYKVGTGSVSDGIGGMDVNLITLKTVMTPEYNYTVEQQVNND